MIIFSVDTQIFDTLFDSLDFAGLHMCHFECRLFTCDSIFTLWYWSYKYSLWVLIPPQRSSQLLNIRQAWLFYLSIHNRTVVPFKAHHRLLGVVLHHLVVGCAHQCWNGFFKDVSQSCQWIFCPTLSTITTHLTPTTTLIISLNYVRVIFVPYGEVRPQNGSITCDCVNRSLTNTN